ncbi:SDR family NAD(P)-dependent oxidoreductase [Aurantivibrio plasticivorans]
MSTTEFSLDSFLLKDRVALVTGASSGIGEAIAKGLAHAGAKVIVAARREDRLHSLVDTINQEANREIALAVSMDVTDADGIHRAFEQGETTFGTITVVINNAGVAKPRHFLKDDVQSRDFVMNTNVNGVWNVAHEAATRMAKANIGGSIVNIASILGYTAKPGQTSYCASKGAVIQLTRSLALDLIPQGIRVNAIAPGWFKTEMNEDFFDSAPGKTFITQMPAKRLGELNELVGPIIMLCSDAGSFINGAVIPVDGAITAAGI